MGKTLYIFHCSENASEVFLINLERYFDGHLVYVDETQLQASLLVGKKVLIIVTDQFLKNKKCLDPLHPSISEDWDIFTVIYYHSGLNRVDKPFDVKSHGKIDLYYYRNFWERRYVHERKWIIDLEHKKEVDHDQYLFELKHLKNDFGNVITLLNSKPRAILEELKKTDYYLLIEWLEGKQYTGESELTVEDDIISRVPSLNVHPKEEDLSDIPPQQQEDPSIESELLKKLVAFKKNQLGDSEIADEYIKEQLAKSQQELENEYLAGKDDKELLEKITPKKSPEISNHPEIPSSIIIEHDAEDLENMKLSEKHQSELEQLLEEQVQYSANKKTNQKDVLSEDKMDKMYYELALYHYNNGNHQQARKYYQLAKRVNPNLSNERNERAFRNEGPLHYDDIPAYHQHTCHSITNYVMITGATSGIGRSTAEKMAAMGHDLIITGRRKKRLKKNAEEWSEQYGVQIVPLRFDVRNNEQTKNAIKKIKENAWPIDVLINNAGLASGLSKIQDGDIEDWDKMIDTNIKGLLHVTRCVLPSMIKRDRGHIINIGSIAGKEVYPSGNVYNATKFAVEALTKAMRLDLAGYNIRVTQISPGHVEETEFAKVRFHGDEKKAQIYQDFNPVTSKDIAEIIYFALTRPPHVNIQDVLVMGTQQASANLIDRSSRKYDQ